MPAVQERFEYFLPLVKADQENHLVYARAAIEQPDKAREIMDYASAVPQFQAWSKQYEEATFGKSLGNVRAMHNPRHLAGKVQEITYNDPVKAVDVCIKVLDPVDWHKIEEGGYTGISIGGGYLRKWNDVPTGMTRYTPRIGEISFVDSPCMPGARFLELQKSDGSTADVLLKGVARTFAELLPPPTFADLHKREMPPIEVYTREMLSMGKPLTFGIEGLDGVDDGPDLLKAALKHSAAHPGFAREQASIVRRQGISPERAGAILAAGARKAGKTAIRHNPRLKRVGGVGARKQELIERLKKDFLTEPDNSVSQWQAGRNDQQYKENQFTLHENKNEFAPYFAPPSAYGDEAQFTQPNTKQEVGAALLEMAKASGATPSSPEQREKIRQVLHEHKEGTLRSWRGVNPNTGKPRRGPKVTNRRQAIAIALSQARRMDKQEPWITAALAGRVAKADGVKLDWGDDVDPAMPRPLAVTQTARITTPAAGAEGNDNAGKRRLRRVKKGEDLLKLAYDERREHIRRSALAGALAGGALGATVGGVRGAGFGAMGGSLLGGGIGAAEYARHQRRPQGQIAAKAQVPSFHQLTIKERAQRVAAAKARWDKEGHPDVSAHHTAMLAHARRAILGRDRKVGQVQGEIEHHWHNVADAQDAYDKMRGHTPKAHAIMMEVPHASGLIYNPEKVAPHHFDADGKPKKKIYLMHPHEVDDWIAKHGTNRSQVTKSEPYGAVQSIHDLFETTGEVVAA